MHIYGSGSSGASYAHRILATIVITSLKICKFSGEMISGGLILRPIQSVFCVQTIVMYGKHHSNCLFHFRCHFQILGQQVMTMAYFVPQHPQHYASAPHTQQTRFRKSTTTAVTGMFL